MRLNLTKKDLVNVIYMQIGYSKNVTENLVDEFFSLIVSSLNKEKKLKISNGNRRYYDKKNIELLKKVHFLLKEQGMTIEGVKKILNNKDVLKLDENFNHSIKANEIKNRLVKISEILKNLKKLK